MGIVILSGSKPYLKESIDMMNVDIIAIVVSMKPAKPTIAIMLSNVMPPIPKNAPKK